MCWLFPSYANDLVQNYCNYLILYNSFASSPRNVPLYFVYGSVALSCNKLWCMVVCVLQTTLVLCVTATAIVRGPCSVEWGGCVTAAAPRPSLSPRMSGSHRYPHRSPRPSPGEQPFQHAFWQTTKLASVKTRT